MKVSGEKFGDYSAGWDANEKVSFKDAKKAGIQVTPLPLEEMSELKKRWSSIEPKSIKDTDKLGNYGKSSVAYYRNE